MLQAAGSPFLSAPFVRVCKTILVCVVTVFALALVFPRLLPVAPIPVALVGMNALFVGISLHDFRTRRVPNMVTYPLITVGVVRALLFRDPSFLIYWGALWLLWTTRFMGAGDAKLLMGLFGLFPDMRMTWLVATSVLVTGIPFLLYKHRHALTNVRDWRSLLKRLGWRLATLQLLPSESEFDNEAVPFAFSFCLAGAVYLLLRDTWT